MIFASCIHCDGDISYGIPDDAKLPALNVQKCGDCGRANVCLASRVEPQGWSLDGALEVYAANPGAIAFIQAKVAALGCVEAPS